VTWFEKRVKTALMDAVAEFDESFGGRFAQLTKDKLEDMDVLLKVKISSASLRGPTFQN